MVFAGNGTVGVVDGFRTQATFNLPHGIARDKDGNIFISDRFGHYLRRIDKNGMVKVIAGSGVASFSDGEGTNAKFSEPLALVFDSKGNLYVSDRANNRVRKVVICQPNTIFNSTLKACVCVPSPYPGFRVTRRMCRMPLMNE